jgi:RND family efflux transporter MFP subunit
VAAVLEAQDWRDAVVAIASVLRQRLRIEQVAVAMVRGSRLGDPLVITSRPIDLEPQANALLAAAQHEALDQQALVVMPCPQATLSGPIREAHRRLHAAQGGCVASLPLMDSGSGRRRSAQTPGQRASRETRRRHDAIGVLSVTRAADAGPLDPDAIEQLRNIAAFVGPILGLHHVVDNRLVARLERRWRRHVPTWAHRPRQAVAALAALVALLLGWPLPDHVKGPARIDIETQRTLVAPNTGFLSQVHARAGDTVHAGQLLVELATDDLRLEHQRLTHALERAESSRAEANARADRAQFVLETARALEARAQLDLIENRLERSRIVAPFDGLVVRGDLSRQLGAPLAEGAELLTLAPPGHWHVVVEVDERWAPRIEPGQAGDLQLSALPWDSLPIRVERIAPIATAAGGSNVFEVRAVVEGSETALRPGLAGQARILVGQRPLAGELVDAAVRPLRRLWWWVQG